MIRTLWIINLPKRGTLSVRLGVEDITIPSTPCAVDIEGSTVVTLLLDNQELFRCGNGNIALHGSNITLSMNGDSISLKFN